VRALERPRPRTARIPHTTASRTAGLSAKSSALPEPLGRVPDRSLSFLRGALIVKQGGEIFWHSNVLAAPIPAANGPSPHARSRGSMPRSPTAERSTVSACFRKRRAPRPR
jgi:hypothetical protein